MSGPLEIPPAPLALRCPGCFRYHEDVGEWALRPHRTHLCAFCGFLWRPSPCNTVGVHPKRAGTILELLGALREVALQKAWRGGFEAGLIAAAKLVAFRAATFCRWRDCPATVVAGSDMCGPHGEKWVNYLTNGMDPSDLDDSQASR